MKAYIIGIKDDPDQGNEIVFDTSVRHAKQFTGDLVYDSWIDIECHRYPALDDCENLSKPALALEQWKLGWWFDSDEPTFDDYEENTDEDFLSWYLGRHEQW